LEKRKFYKENQYQRPFGPLGRAGDWSITQLMKKLERFVSCGKNTDEKERAQARILKKKRSKENQYSGPPGRWKTSGPEKNMKKYNSIRAAFLTGFMALFILAIFVGGASATGGSGKASGLVKRLEERYRSIKTLTADFRQVSKGLSSMDGASGGKVYFKRPGRIRWSYKGDITDEIIGDGKVIWFYQPDLNQVFKSRETDPGISTDFLSGMMNIRKYFRASEDGKKKGLVSIRLEPREYHPQIKALVLLVDGKTLLVKSFVLTDHYGNTTTVTFSKIRVNPPIDDEMFTFTPPQGTVIIEK